MDKGKGGGGVVSKLSQVLANQVNSAHYTVEKQAAVALGKLDSIVVHRQKIGTLMLP